MTAFIDTEDNVAQATCCADNFFRLMLSMGEFLLVILLIAIPFQYVIYKKPRSLMAIFFKWGLYLLGTLILLFFGGLMYEFEGETLTNGPVIAAFYALIFSSYFLVTHHLTKFKSFSRFLLFKILAAVVIAQILVQIEMRVQFLSKLLYF